MNYQSAFQISNFSFLTQPCPLNYVERHAVMPYQYRQHLRLEDGKIIYG